MVQQHAPPLPNVRESRLFNPPAHPWTPRHDLLDMPYFGATDFVRGHRERLFAVGGCAAACTGAVERLMKTSLVGLVTEQDCSYLLPANVVSLLLDTGVDPNTQYMGMTPLALAASNAALPIVEALIAHGADVNAPYEIRGADGRRTTVSPLALAAMTASGRSRSPCHGGETVLEQERFYRKWNHKKWYDLYTYRKSEEQEQEEAASCHESALRTMEALAANASNGAPCCSQRPPPRFVRPWPMLLV